jgi:O-antigen/teichoic acid export membrane protein
MSGQGPNPELRRAARGSTLNLVGAAVSAVATFALTVVITHGTTKIEAGVFFATTSLFIIATSIGQLGTNTGLVYFIARAVESGRRHLLQAYVRAALGPVVVCAIAMALVLFVAAPEVARVTNPTEQEAATRSLRALALLVPFVGLESVLLSATRGLGTMRPYALVEQVVRPVLQLVLAAVIVTTGTALDLAWSWSLPYAVAGLLAWRAWRRLTEQDTPDTGVSEAPSVSRPFWSFTAPRSLASAAQMAMQRLDIVLVAAMSGPGPAAVYTAATRFVVAGQLARTAVSLAVQPHLARALAREGKDNAVALYQTSTAWLMAVTWPLFLVLVLDGSLLMRVFGPGYGAGTTVLVLLGLSMLVATFCGDVDIMLIMAGRTRSSMINMLVALVVQLGLDLWLIPGHGILGAAIGWSCSIVVKNLLALVQVGAILGMHPLGRGTALVATLATACFGGCLGLVHLVGGGSVAAVLGLAVACAAYAAGLYLVRRDLGLDSLGGVLSRRTKRTSVSAQMP